MNCDFENVWTWFVVGYFVVSAIMSWLKKMRGEPQPAPQPEQATRSPESEDRGRAAREALAEVLRELGLELPQQEERRAPPERVLERQAEEDVEAEGFEEAPPGAEGVSAEGVSYEESGEELTYEESRQHYESVVDARPSYQETVGRRETYEERHARDAESGPYWKPPEVARSYDELLEAGDEFREATVTERVSRPARRRALDATLEIAPIARPGKKIDAGLVRDAVVLSAVLGRRLPGSGSA